jgi:hypothetical protein
VFRTLVTLLTFVVLVAAAGCADEGKQAVDVRTKPTAGEYRPYDPGRKTYDKPPNPAEKPRRP